MINPNFRWHDLRHTWATERINEGVPENIIMEEQGWLHPQMVKRYGHLRREARAAALQKGSETNLIISDAYLPSGSDCSPP